MNAGEKAIEFLYSNQLGVDQEWSIRTPNGFTWWADRNAQTIEIAAEESGPEGDTGYLISVQTDVLRNFELSDESVMTLNEELMTTASMAGPVYEEQTRILRLCSLVLVHEGNLSWINPLIGVAAVLQLSEASDFGAKLAGTLAAQEATSGHPQRGVRRKQDDMAKMVALAVVPAGRNPCAWTNAEFRDAVEEYMHQPPSIGATAGSGFTVEFPYGPSSTSLCRVWNEPHPRYGNGILLLQSFPVEKMTIANGARLALSLNAGELTEKPSMYGFGSHCYREGMIHFTSFWPNLAYREGLLGNIYFSCAQRAREMSVRLTETDWTGKSFDPQRTPILKAVANWVKRKRKLRNPARAEEETKENLRVESAAYVLASRALPKCVAAYAQLRGQFPKDRLLDDDQARSVGGAVLLYGLYCRLLELEHADPTEAMNRAFTRLESEPEFHAELLAAWRRGYEAMCAYNVFRSNVTIVEFIGERAWHLAYPGEEVVNDSAFQRYVEVLATESYAKLHEWNMV